MVTLQPEVVIIDSEGEDSTLLTHFLVEYAVSNKDAINASGSLLGTVEINVLFESNRVRGEPPPPH